MKWWHWALLGIPWILAPIMLVLVCIAIPKLAVGLGLLLLLHSPIILIGLFGSPKAKRRMLEELRGYHPPGHE